MDIGFGFKVHLSIVRAENTTKSYLIKTNNNAQGRPEQLQYHFENSRKLGFFTQKSSKKGVPTLTKVSFYGGILDLKPLLLS